MTITDDQPPQHLQSLLQKHNQQHVLKWWPELQPVQRDQLAAQLEAINLDSITRLYEQKTVEQSADNTDSAADRAVRARPPGHMVRLPANDQQQADWDSAARLGNELLADGQVGVILVAGGQGTRLGFPHPKGMFPLGPVTNASLFQLLLDQVQARAVRSGVVIPYYIMTSDATHDDTVAFFEKNNYFGHNKADIHFFKQGSMPAVDDATGRLLLKEQDALCLSPDGHGGLLTALKKAGMLQDMATRGIEYLFYHQVDNPTAIVCDPALIGWHVERKSELTTKVVAKRSAEEKMGIVVDVDGTTQIIEYSDLPAEVAAKTDDDDNLLLWAGNMAIHVFNRSFLERLTEGEGLLPFHIAHKKVPHIDADGQPVEPTEPNAYKFERFIFDALPFAERALVVEADRAAEFNPVKNADGNDSPATAQAALTNLHKRWLQQAGASIAEDAVVEISALYALSAEDLKGKIDTENEYTGSVYLGD